MWPGGDGSVYGANTGGWTRVGTVPNLSALGGTGDAIFDRSVTARYFRIEVTAATANVVTITALRFFAPPAVITNPNLARNRGIAINSETGFPVSRLTDGNVREGSLAWRANGQTLARTPGWSGINRNIWAGADLRNNTMIDTVIVSEQSLMPALQGVSDNSSRPAIRSWVLEVATLETLGGVNPNNNNSLDANGWTAVASGGALTGEDNVIHFALPNTAEFASGARFVRIRTLSTYPNGVWGTVQGTNFAVQLTQFEVFNTNAVDPSTAVTSVQLWGSGLPAAPGEERFFIADTAPGSASPFVEWHVRAYTGGVEVPVAEDVAHNTASGAVTIPGTSFVAGRLAISPFETADQLVITAVSPNGSLIPLVIDGNTVFVRATDANGELVYDNGEPVFTNTPVMVPSRITSNAITIPINATLPERIVVTPNTTSVNFTQQPTFEAIVVGGNPTQNVIWSIDGRSHPQTTINPVTGLLTLSRYETPRTVLTIRATSVLDTAVYGTARVTVLGLPPLAFEIRSGNNLARTRTAVAIANTFYFNYATSRLNDGAHDTATTTGAPFWQGANTGGRTAWGGIDLGFDRAFNSVIIFESIDNQRINHWVLEVATEAAVALHLPLDENRSMDATGWIPIAVSTFDRPDHPDYCPSIQLIGMGIGHQRLFTFDTVIARYVRLRITDSGGAPRVTQFEVYNHGEEILRFLYPNFPESVSVNQRDPFTLSVRAHVTDMARNANFTRVDFLWFRNGRPVQSGFVWASDFNNRFFDFEHFLPAGNHEQRGGEWELRLTIHDDAGQAIMVTRGANVTVVTPSVGAGGAAGAGGGTPPWFVPGFIPEELRPLEPEADALLRPVITPLPGVPAHLQGIMEAAINNVAPFDWAAHAPNGFGRFADVASHAWYFSFVEMAAERGLFQGTAPGVFNPAMSMSRAMVAQVLANLEGTPGLNGVTPNFYDVVPSEWYFPVVEWAFNEGIVSGMGYGIFDPDSAVTREQIAVMLFNYANANGINLPGNASQNFVDQGQISYWAVDAVNAMRDAGIISGNPDGTFAPQANATRAEVATIFVQFLTRMNL